MKKLFLIPLALFTLIACTDANRPAQLNKIEAMQSSVDSLEGILSANRIDTLAGLRIQIDQVILRIKNNYISDTIDMEFGRVMDEYKVMLKSLNSFGRNHSTLQAGILEEKNALKQLKIDIEQGNGKSSKYDEYIAFENNKVNQLQLLATEFADQKAKIDKAFNAHHEKLKAYSFELMENNK